MSCSGNFTLLKTKVNRKKAKNKFISHRHTLSMQNTLNTPREGNPHHKTIDGAYTTIKKNEWTTNYWTAVAKR